MTTSTNQIHGTVGSTGCGRGDRTRELIELGALLCVAAAYLFAIGMREHVAGASALIAAGGAILLAALVRRRWLGRQVEVPPPRDEGGQRPRSSVEVAEFGPEDLDVVEVHDQNRVLWRLRASVSDSPGRLARLAAGLAALGGNIRTLQVHPVAGGAVDDVLLHVPAEVTAAELTRAVEQAGGRGATACRADVRELDDVPTRTLILAKDLVEGRSELVRALHGLLGDVEIQWQEEPEPPLGSDDVAEREMCLRAPGGGVLVLRRRTSAFTPAEFARARALAELGAGCRARSSREKRSVTTTAGDELRVRLADRDDLPLLTEFHERCSSAARYRRYFSPGPAAGEKGLLRLLTPALGRSVIVQACNGDVLAMGNLMYDDDTAEIALLVRDDWQRRGIGVRLARTLIEEADSLGITTVNAHTHVDNTAIARTLRAAGLKLSGVPEPGEWCWTRTRPRALSAVS